MMEPSTAIISAEDIKQLKSSCTISTLPPIKLLGLGFCPKREISSVKLSFKSDPTLRLHFFHAGNEMEQKFYFEMKFSLFFGGL